MNKFLELSDVDKIKFGYVAVEWLYEIEQELLMIKYRPSKRYYDYGNRSSWRNLILYKKYKDWEIQGCLSSVYQSLNRAGFYIAHPEFPRLNPFEEQSIYDKIKLLNWNNR